MIEGSVSKTKTPLTYKFAFSTVCLPLMECDDGHPVRWSFLHAGGPSRHVNIGGPPPWLL